MGNAHPNIVPYQVFASADGHLIVAVGNDGQFTSLCHVLALAELAKSEDYMTNAARVRNRDQLCEQIQETLLNRTTAEWLTKLESVNVPCGPINTIEQVFQDPQLLARDMLHSEEHLIAGEVKLVATPIKFTGEEKSRGSAPPVLNKTQK